MSTSPFRETSSLRIVDETALDNGDEVFTMDQLEQMDAQLLRRLAAHANTDCINGKSVFLEIRSYFARQRTLTEFRE